MSPVARRGDEKGPIGRMGDTDDAPTVGLYIIRRHFVITPSWCVFLVAEKVEIVEVVVAWRYLTCLCRHKR